MTTATDVADELLARRRAEETYLGTVRSAYTRRGYAIHDWAVLSTIVVAQAAWIGCVAYAMFLALA